MYRVTIALKTGAPSDAVKFFNEACKTLFQSTDDCTIIRWNSEQSLVGDTSIDVMLEFQFQDKGQADRYFADRRLTMFHRTAANYFNDLEVRYFSIAPGK